MSSGERLAPAPRQGIGAPPLPARPLRLASFNVHAGVDGWGQPFDVAQACRSLNADVLVMQENWSVDAGPGVAGSVGEQLGYRVIHQPMARGRRALPSAPGRGWGPTVRTRGDRASFFLDSERPLPPESTASPRYREGVPGTIGVAVLSRLPVVDVSPIDLGRLPRDGAHRWALAVRVDWDGHPMTVVGTHMSHIWAGSPRQLRRLRLALEPLRETGPVALCGDMNMWGPPLVALLTGWRRAVRGPSWPAWRPHSQLDHILISGVSGISGSVEVLRSGVGPAAGSDHRPVWVEISPPPYPEIR